MLYWPARANKEGTVLFARFILAIVGQFNFFSRNLENTRARIHTVIFKENK